jgi:hypothetical protein
MKQRISLCLAAVAAMASTARADDAGGLDIEQAEADPSVPDVQPFGGLTWDDSMGEAVAKIAKLGKLDKLDVSFSTKYAASALGATTPQQADAVIERVMKQTIDFPKELQRKGALAANWHPFTDKDGAEWHFWQGAKIDAEPVVLNGVAYHLLVDLEASPGVAAADPKRVLWAKGEPKLANPMFIMTMHLTALSGTDEQKHGVLQAINKKYRVRDVWQGDTTELRFGKGEGYFYFYPSNIRFERNPEARDEGRGQGRGQGGPGRCAVRVAILIVAALATTAHAGKGGAGGADSVESRVAVEPFGGLAWTDSLPEAIAKLNRLDGAKSTAVHFGLVDGHVDGARDAAAAKAGLDRLIAAWRKAANPKAREREFDETFAKATGADGKELRYAQVIELRTESVNIHGVPYRVVAVFHGEPCVALAQPGNVVRSAADARIAQPLLLAEVRLEPLGGTKADFVAIFDLMSAKYGGPSAHSEGGAVSVRRDNGIVDYQRSRDAIAACQATYEAQGAKRAVEGRPDAVNKF